MPQNDTRNQKMWVRTCPPPTFTIWRKRIENANELFSKCASMSRESEGWSQLTFWFVFDSKTSSIDWNLNVLQSLRWPTRTYKVPKARDNYVRVLVSFSIFVVSVLRVNYSEKLCKTCYTAPADIRACYAAVVLWELEPPGGHFPVQFLDCIQAVEPTWSRERRSLACTSASCCCCYIVSCIFHLHFCRPIKLRYDSIPKIKSRLNWMVRPLVRTDSIAM